MFLEALINTNPRDIDTDGDFDIVYKTAVADAVGFSTGENLSLLTAEGRAEFQFALRHWLHAPIHQINTSNATASTPTSDAPPIAIRFNGAKLTLFSRAYFKTGSHTVGTPADTVTPSLVTNSAKAWGSLSFGPGITNFAPNITPLNGNPQALT